MQLDRLRDRYQNDAAFHTMVDVLQGAILNMQLTPSEVREAAMLACCMIEERYPKPIRLGSEEYEAFTPPELTEFAARGYKRRGKGEAK